MLTRDEIADRLKVSAATVKVWGRHGLLPRPVCNDKDEWLYEPPGPNAPIKMQGRRLSDRRRSSTSSRISPMRCSMKRSPSATGWTAVR